MKHATTRPPLLLDLFGSEEENVGQQGQADQQRNHSN
jgi:hypothetical protein